MKLTVPCCEGLTSRSARRATPNGPPIRRAPANRLSATCGWLAALVALGCGAGGEQGEQIGTTSTGAAGGGPSDRGETTAVETMLTPTDCQGPSCGLGTVTTAAAPLGCGDGTLDADEACDDNNEVSGDGCSSNCLVTEPGFSCAQEGQPCRPIAQCGDSIVAPTEQCDDGNSLSGDGCSERCRVELGKKCEGEPSVCTDAECGNNVREGAEACDDGNTDPFDGCSPTCLKEPNCDGQSCVSECGDGLLLGEECDDGNLIDGDGCSSSCTREGGFICTSEPVCEEIGGQCAIRVSAIFRDFSGNQPDFGNFPTVNTPCQDLAPGAVADTLGPDGRPRLSGNVALQNAACMSTQDNFSQWYVDTPDNAVLVSELVLFQNEDGGYVNRFGAQGEQFRAVDTDTEIPTGAGTLAGCQNACINRARDGQAPFQGQGQLRCDANCQPQVDAAQQFEDGQLNQLNNQLNQALNANEPDEELIAERQQAVAAGEAQLVALQQAAATCQTTCETALEERIASCSATCKECGANPDQFCIGGEFLYFDGSPLFFPVDSVQGPTASSVAATIPEQYGYDFFPLESEIFPNAPNHNFYFTSEVQYWFPYNAETQATLTFLGDDDVWVYLNGRLAVDLGGLHVPSRGSIEIDAANGRVISSIRDGRVNANGQFTGIEREEEFVPQDFGLQEGNVYKISIFHAERQENGSSFQLTLAGFEAAPSQCEADCGDGNLSFGEECDDGENDGGYNECGVGCKLGPFCGDGVVQAEFGENCDVGPGGDPNCRGCRESILL